MKEIVRMLVSVAVGAAAFLLLFLELHWNLLFCAVAGIGVYAGFFCLLKPSRKIAGIDVETMRDGEELQRLLEEAGNDLKEMEKAVGAIADTAVKQNAEVLFGTGTRILSYLQENPDKIKLARRFFNYYLDMAAKLLSRYIKFQNTGVKSREVLEILEKTAKALPVLNTAFEKQFTHLMEGELLDVEADIELLKSTLEMEGGK